MTKSAHTLLAILATGALLSSPLQAADLSCPDLASAVQVAPCPSEAELRYTYNGFCSDNSRLYGRDILLCANYEDYRAAKNIALWESADGEFSGYLSCNVEPASIHASQPLTMTLQRQRGLSLLHCDYENDHRLTHRTRAQCTVEVADCQQDNCRARCE